MSYPSISNIFRGLAKTSFAAGAILLGLTVSGAQAATVTVYSNNLAGWQAATGSPGVGETFGTDVAAPGPAAVAFGSIAFGDDVPGEISAGMYRDRANDNVAEQTANPLFTFSGLGVTAFGADWDLGPNDPGTGIAFFVTFADLSTQLVATELSNTFSGQFFGIISDMAILSIRLMEGTQGGNFETFTMDDARFVSAVPIPAALPLFLSALAALGFVGRRKKRLAAA